MRLLDTYTGQFVEKDPTDSDTKYAILSHTWDAKGEQTYKQLKRIQKRHPPRAWNPLVPSGASPRLRISPIWKHPQLSPKVRDACVYARAEGFRYIWIDSCCIDKTSSSELSEAINSMYMWYGRADVCYAFLADVPPNEDHEKKGSCFRESRWFTRGWTLQELLAPPHLVFLAQDWTPLGSKLALVELVHLTTNISPVALLQPGSLDTFSIAQRLSWAAKRQTSRAEDRAYSLLGIFDINMPILYGEGERAFRRLQEEILRRMADQTLFAWLDFGRIVYPWPTYPLSTPNDLVDKIWILHETQPRHIKSLLSSSLNAFADGGAFTAVPPDEVFQRLSGERLRLPAPDYAFTPLGIRTQLPFIPIVHILPTGVMNHVLLPSLSQYYVVILGCEHKDFPGCLLGRVCCIPPSLSGIEFLYDGFVNISPNSGNFKKGAKNPKELNTPLLPSTVSLFPLSQSAIEHLAPHIELRAVHICHPRPMREVLDGARDRPHEQIHLHLGEESRGALRSPGGYTVAYLEGPNDAHPCIHRLALENKRNSLVIACEHVLKDRGKKLTMKVEVRVVQLCAREVGKPHIQRMEVKTLSWTDSVPWAPTLWRSKGVSLYAGEGAKVNVNVRLDFVVTNHYVLHIEVQNK